MDEKKKSRIAALAEKAGVPVEEAIAKNMSQSALKKIASKKRYAELIKIKRQEQKELRRKNREEKKEAGTYVKKKRKPNYLMNNSENKVIVAIDLQHYHLMSEKDLQKLRKQILRCYSMNRACENPLQFYLTSCTQEIKDSFLSITTGFSNWDVHMSNANFLETFKEMRSHENGIVYLTRDSDNVLPEPSVIQENMGKSVYVIGGLVDHNSYKRLTIDMAMKEKISHARLPIAENIRMTRSHVLTVNHVFELMLLASRGDSWKSALEQVIPQRKLYKDLNGSQVESSINHSSQDDPSESSSNEEQTDEG